MRQLDPKCSNPSSASAGSADGGDPIPTPNAFSADLLAELARGVAEATRRAYLRCGSCSARPGQLQSSIRSPSMRPNSPVLWVTRTAPRARAVAAISTS